jgi:hypothetical protein
VLQVGGGPPQSLDQFLGDTAFVIDKAGNSSTISGQGAGRGAEVRFHEKAAAGSGKDTRIWTISVSAEGDFTAAAVSDY